MRAWRTVAQHQSESARRPQTRRQAPEPPRAEIEAHERRELDVTPFPSLRVGIPPRAGTAGSGRRDRALGHAVRVRGRDDRDPRRARRRQDRVGNHPPVEVGHRHREEDGGEGRARARPRPSTNEEAGRGEFRPCFGRECADSLVARWASASPQRGEPAGRGSWRSSRAARRARARPRRARPRHGAPPARPRARRADEDRERDAVEIRSGVRHGRTLGSPIAVLVANRDYPNWEERMNPWPVDGAVDEVHPAAGARGPRRAAQVRAYRRAQRARARQRPRDRRAGRRRRAGEGVPRRGRGDRSQPRPPDRQRSRCRARRASRPRTSPASTTRPCAASIPKLLPEWSTRSTGCERTTRRSGERSRWSPLGSSRPRLARRVGRALDARLAQATVSIQAIKGVSLGEA